MRIYGTCGEMALRNGRPRQRRRRIQAKVRTHEDKGLLNRKTEIENKMANNQTRKKQGTSKLHSPIWDRKEV